MCYAYWVDAISDAMDGNSRLYKVGHLGKVVYNLLSNVFAIIFLVPCFLEIELQIVAQTYFCLYLEVHVQGILNTNDLYILI